MVKHWTGNKWEKQIKFKENLVKVFAQDHFKRFLGRLDERNQK